MAGGIRGSDRSGIGFGLVDDIARNEAGTTGRQRGVFLEEQLRSREIGRRDPDCDDIF